MTYAFLNRLELDSDSDETSSWSIKFSTTFYFILPPSGDHDFNGVSVQLKPK